MLFKTFCLAFAKEPWNKGKIYNKGGVHLSDWLYVSKFWRGTAISGFWEISTELFEGILA